MAQKDLLTRLADAGENAIKTLGDAPGADRFLGAANAMRDRLDELQKRVRGLEGLEQRLADLERKVDRMSKSGGTSSASSTRKTASASSSKKTTSARKTTSS
jgi:cell division septum initiation protein DivIVA